MYSIIENYFFSRILLYAIFIFRNTISLVFIHLDNRILRISSVKNELLKSCSRFDKKEVFLFTVFSIISCLKYESIQIFLTKREHLKEDNTITIIYFIILKSEGLLQI